MSLPIILFLDIDGVFNSHRLNGHQQSDKSIINKFAKTIQAFPIQIVWSTSHRILHSGKDALYGEGYEKMLQRNNLMKLHKFTHTDWKTPYVGTPNRIRGDEVDAWLEKHAGEYGNFLCIDDDADFYPHQYVFQTDGASGLTLQDISLIEKILRYMSDSPVEYDHSFDSSLRKKIILGRNLNTLLTLKRKRETWNKQS